jgi:hypothetical protein
MHGITDRLEFVASAALVGTTGPLPLSQNDITASKTC